MNLIVIPTRGQVRNFCFEGIEVRTVLVGGEPHFVAKDVAEALGYTWNGSARIAHIPEEWRGVTSVVTPFGERDMAVLSEPGLYFFLGRSDKAAALPMQKWIAGEVLPAIRRDGGYMVMRPEETPEQLMARALQIAQETLKRRDTELAVARPKAAALDRLEASEGSVNLTEAAKTLNIPPRKLTGFMERSRWMYRRAGRGEWVAYQARIEAGVLEHRPRTYEAHGEQRVTSQVMVTAKGLGALAKLMGAMKDAA